MTIEKINFKYPRKSIQSNFKHEEMTALELAAATAGKVDACIDRVNGVEQIAIEATAIVDLMKAQQDAFILDNDDTRAQMLADNQDLLDALSASNANFQTQVHASKTNFETFMNTALENFKTNINTSKTTFETDINTALNTFTTTTNTQYETFTAAMNDAIDAIIADSEDLITTATNNKVNSLVSDGTIGGLINSQILGEIKDDIENLESNVSVHNTQIGIQDTKITNLTTHTNLNTQRIADIYKNVKNYGAIGNGVEDDTEAIQTALNSFDDRGGVLFFPKGQYKVTSSLIFPHMTSDNLLAPFIKIKGANGISTDRKSVV